MKSQQQTYLFGYGSLICAHSRSLTCPEVKDRICVPAVIHGIERVWSRRTRARWTAMGVRFRDDTRCAGVLMPLESPHELTLFDEREQGYQRVRVDLDRIQKLPFLEHAKEEHLDVVKHDKHHKDFFASLEKATAASEKLSETSSCVSSENNTDDDGAEMEEASSDEEPISVWVYVPDQMRPPTQEYPIIQSYVDTILRGCLAVGGEAFCQEFLATTKGWHLEDWPATAYGTNERAVRAWVNDRDDPVYPRGDALHSLENAEYFDALMQQHRSDYFPLRVSAAAAERKQHPGNLVKAGSKPRTAVKKTSKRQTQ